jgi:DNA-binding NarL/FixJ family response regulator
LRFPAGNSIQNEVLGNPFNRDDRKETAGQKLVGSGHASQKSVLVIDEDPNALLAIQQLLQNRRPNWRIEGATDGGSGLWLIQKDDYDAVICEMSVAGIHGLAVLEKVKEMDPNIVRVAMTAFADEQWRAERSNCAAQAIILKPCTSAELIRAVEHPQNFGTPGAARFGARSTPVRADKEHHHETHWDDDEVVDFA